MSFLISSPAFAAERAIPPRYTVDGADLSPPLSWHDVPHGTASLALVVEDPDVGPEPWVHWLVYNIRPTTHALAEGASRRGLPLGARSGLNGWGRAGYAGPRHPSGRHHYVHHLYAVDIVLPELGRATHPELCRAIGAHLIAVTQLTGIYERSEKSLFIKTDG